MEDADVKALTEHLCSLGCDEHEIAQILDRVRDYDRQTIRQSVFDSIASGAFNIDAIVNEVRAKSVGEDSEEANKP